MAGTSSGECQYKLSYVGIVKTVYIREGGFGVIPRWAGCPFIFKNSYENLLKTLKEKKKIKRISANVPHGILSPEDGPAILHDIKVNCYGPDDTIYNNDPEVRKNVPRGVTLLEFKGQFDLVIFANKKFTGGIGDEDDKQPETNDLWKQYCLEDLKKLGDQENKIENLKKENSTLQDNQMKLRIQYDNEKKQYETEYAIMLDEKDRQFQHISEDKDKQIKDLADEKEKLTDLINSNNTSISRQQREELNRKINTNLMSLTEYQLKLAACENDIRIQNIQFLECQQALQKCNYDKQSDQKEYNNLLVSQNNYVQECQQKLLDCENSKKIKYDEYNTLVKHINEANKYNIETLEQLYTKPTLSNSDIIHCFSSIFPLNDDNESKATGKSQIEAIINKFIHQLNTERDNYIHEEREKDIRDRISRLNYINNNDLRQNNNILNIFTNEEERNLFNQILEKFKNNIIDETVYEHERQIIPYVNENDHLKRQLDEPNYVAKLLIDAVASIVLVKENINKRIVDLEKDHKGTNEEVIKVYAFVTILYTLFQKEIRQDLNANNVQRFYYIILNVIRKSPSDNIHEILALQQQNDLHIKTLQEENETITSNLLTIQQTNDSLQDSNKQMLSELSETRMHLSMINHDETSVDPIEYEETQMNKFTLIIQAVTTQLDAYLAGTCNNKYLRSAFEKLSMRKMFCKNEMAKSEMMQLFISLSNHIFQFIFCAQFYKNLVTVSDTFEKK
ncbi:putative leucine-rich repeat-containing protein DDB_G0290503 [Procambarus clarkii]|uniref:putative leucine-rich repeat-containing protein DDB_G0290503 n=1 Tax=Procambarus clarkii TaxID=6728 RepID=UPI003744A51D